MSDRPMNVAVVGCGMLAQMAHIPNIQRSDRMVLHTCCDTSADALARCRDEFGALHTTDDYLAAIGDPDVDVICLATTERFRIPPIRAAAEAGKPIYCEKPIAQTLEEMVEIRDILRANPVPFCAGHNRRSILPRRGAGIFQSVKELAAGQSFEE